MIDVQEIMIAEDAISFDLEAQERLLRHKPWKEDPVYFDNVKISVSAMLRMMSHAEEGGQLEVMGILQGHIEECCIVVTSVFAIPVSGTETRVNAQAEAYEYMVEHMRLSEMLGNCEKVVGWYHSHPGYGCWLSKIDIDTQSLNQKFQDPFLAIVVDPRQTLQDGQVHLRAFRTFEDYQHPGVSADLRESIPAEKIAEFGAHANRYYQLAVQYFCTGSEAAILEGILQMGLSQEKDLGYYWDEATEQVEAVLEDLNRTEQVATSKAAHSCGQAALVRLVKRAIRMKESE